MLTSDTYTDQILAATIGFEVSMAKTVLKQERGKDLDSVQDIIWEFGDCALHCRISNLGGVCNWI